MQIGKAQLRKKYDTRLEVGCTAVSYGWSGGERALYLVSAHGPETAVKAMRAWLHQETSKHTLDVRFPDRREGDKYVSGWAGWDLRPAADGYRTYLTRLDRDTGTWHLLALTKAEGFLPVLTDETLWQELRKEKYTTPLLRGWVPWLRQKMQEQNRLEGLQQTGCACGLLNVGDAWLDGAVSHGLKNGEIKIDG